jgi:alpha-glucosidase
VLAGQIAEYIAMARRQGDRWFIGTMTDETGRELVPPLDFLDAGAYHATIYADGPQADSQPEQVMISHQLVRSSDQLVARLAPGGGYAVHLTPADAS